MGETAIVTVPTVSSPSARLRRGIGRRIARSAGRSVARVRRGFRNLRTRSRARRSAISYRRGGGGAMKVGKVVFWWAVGAASYALVDVLLERAGLDSSLARAIIGVGAGICLIVFAKGTFAQIGVGMTISAAGHLLNDELKSA